uniref:Uncharacterized protein n=1 Tax=Tanacetum cinerariifolium TaxID=118510 RepID=A0A699GSF6_TANCI|nr:hypothetical protein [Tanacetum cinerariifolium]
MASPQAFICKPSKKHKFTIIPPKQLFIDLTKKDTTTSSPKFQVSSSSAPNATSKTPSTKDTSSSPIDYPPKSPTLLSSPFTNGYLNYSLSPPPRVLLPPPTQAPNSMEITPSLDHIHHLEFKEITLPQPPPLQTLHQQPANIENEKQSRIKCKKITTFPEEPTEDEPMEDERKELLENRINGLVYHNGDEEKLVWRVVSGDAELVEEEIPWMNEDSHTNESSGTKRKRECVAMINEAFEAKVEILNEYGDKLKELKITKDTLENIEGELQKMRCELDALHKATRTTPWAVKVKDTGKGVTEGKD